MAKTVYDYDSNEEDLMTAPSEKSISKGLKRNYD